MSFLLEIEKNVAGLFNETNLKFVLMIKLLISPIASINNWKNPKN